MSPEELVRNVSATVLAGGKSSRMGRLKSLLPFDGELLIAHFLRKLKNKFAEIIVVAARIRNSRAIAGQVKLIWDDWPFQGPVGGMYYGLEATSAEIGFITSYDAHF
jgi:molybdenum cofactor guanylyltransferase